MRKGAPGAAVTGFEPAAPGGWSVKENAVSAFNIWSIVYGAVLIAGLIVVVERGL